jgi:hypothetical protein
VWGGRLRNAAHAERRSHVLGEHGHEEIPFTRGRGAQHTASMRMPVFFLRSFIPLHTESFAVWPALWRVRAWLGTPPDASC